ncbi:AMP-dependent acyl-CoA synthetase [Kibdelosporangium phytohabitans]|uniref:AMP-dependent acyl-CoA synthetase n=2 Tax=Kibdelosporangium phytohabitans TaxID=860235 RepID=A0A0N9I4G4_9PSEU|nr:class I adenylate-forming enzyme family protein [Kibdelosporangium phytohabitans]ALG10780.1 AMP-dependent acyl-CoA synthetase [Kibdelosporangium phytohabitans]
MHSPERVAEYTGKGWWTGETVQQLFADCVARYADEIAIADPANKADLVDLPPRRSTWRELDDEVDRLAAVLLANGIGEGDVLAVQLPNSIELTVAYLAAWRVRAIVSPLPVQYRRHEMVELGTIGEITAFLTADRIGKRSHVSEILDARASIPSLRAILYFGPSDVSDAVAAGPAMAAAGEDDRSRVRAHEAQHPVDPNDCVTICWTSGTESRPKGVPRAHYDWLLMTQGTVFGPGLTHESRLLNPFPMVNMAGISGMLLPWLSTGCVLVQHHPFDLPVFLRQIKDERITYTVAPPAVLALLLQREELLATTDLSTLRQIGSGSAPLQEWMVRGWYEKYGISIINFFGSNEGIALMTDVNLMTDPAQRARFFPRYGSGRKWTIPAAAQTAVRLVDRETGEEITEAGRPGELRLKGPSLFPGYLAASGAPSPFDDEGFLKTGDVFVIDGEDDEFLRYVDRARDLIIRGGVNISPAELETMIAGHPSVAEVAVVGYPDDVLGERVCAVVAHRPDTTITLPDLITHLNRQEIATYKLPERLVVVGALPRNPVGKVLKRELRDFVRDANNI